MWDPRGASVEVVITSIRAPSVKIKKQDSKPFAALTYRGPAVASK
jgi:hypothetical protein